MIPRSVSLISSRALLADYFSHFKIFLYYFFLNLISTTSGIFGLMNVQPCATPHLSLPHRLFPSPLPHCPSVSLAVRLCSLSMCSANAVSKQKPVVFECDVKKE